MDAIKSGLSTLHSGLASAGKTVGDSITKGVKTAGSNYSGFSDSAAKKFGKADSAFGALNTAEDVFSLGKDIVDIASGKDVNPLGVAKDVGAVVKDGLDVSHLSNVSKAAGAVSKGLGVAGGAIGAGIGVAEIVDGAKNGSKHNVVNGVCDTIAGVAGVVAACTPGTPVCVAALVVSGVANLVHIGNDLFFK